MLTDEEKQFLIDQRIKYYETKIFELEMDKVASLVNGDPIEMIEHNVEGLHKAIESVRNLL